MVGLLPPAIAVQFVRAERHGAKAVRVFGVVRATWQNETGMTSVEKEYEMRIGRRFWQ